MYIFVALVVNSVTARGAAEVERFAFHAAQRNATAFLLGPPLADLTVSLP